MKSRDLKGRVEKAQVLIEALPYIRAFSGKVIVIKYGGHAMTEPGLRTKFAEDVVLMKYVGLRPIVVHGGGPQINEMMRRLGKRPTFVKGLRVTDGETMEIVEMVLGGTINKSVVSLIQHHGGRAVGITGKDGGLLTARKAASTAGVDLGMAGEIESVEPGVLDGLDQGRYIPVIAPVAEGKDGKTYNVNADSAAGAIAGALRAEKLLMLTDVSGILDEKGRLLPTLSRKEAARLIRRGVIAEGMVPKVQACLAALEAGVTKTHIIDGRVPHALLLEVFTDKGVGTEIVR